MRKKSQPKFFVVDTNVVLFDPEAIFKLDDNNVIIPELVLEEVDRFKNEQAERGQNSRRFSRYLDDLAKKGSLEKGVSLGEGKGIIRVEFSENVQGKSRYTMDTVDNKILFLCQYLAKAQPKQKVVLITKDVNLRVKASTIGVVAEDYRNDKVIFSNESSYTGRTAALCASKILNEFHKCATPIYQEHLLGLDGEQFAEALFVNEFIELYSSDTNNQSATLARFDGEKFVPLKYAKTFPKGIKPRNIGQTFALECLMQPPEVAPLVILKGNAGTGKTFLALAAGLDMYANSKKTPFNRILICRPSVTMDENLGFLPGTEKDKIAPYMRAIKDNVLSLHYGDKIMSPKEYRDANEDIERMFEDDFIKTEALAYQRGRSLNFYWFILDEMQNSTIRQAKSIVTRGGTGTKIILMGDPDQIDSPYLDSYSNGLTYTSEKMKGSELCWQVTMKDSECVRSKLSQEAAARM